MKEKVTGYFMQVEKSQILAGFPRLLPVRTYANINNNTDTTRGKQLDLFPREHEHRATPPPHFCLFPVHGKHWGPIGREDSEVKTFCYKSEIRSGVEIQKMTERRKVRKKTQNFAPAAHCFWR